MTHSNALVLYATRSGNTRKVAEGIAQALGCQARQLEEGTTAAQLQLNRYDLIFLGTGVYGDTPHKNVVHFINSLDSSNTYRFALFITWLGRGKSGNNAVDQCRERLEKKGQEVVEGHFQCYGRTLFFLRRSHPNHQDIEDARAWAKRLLSGCRE